MQNTETVPIVMLIINCPVKMRSFKMEITFDVWLKLGSRIQELRSQQYCVLPLAPHLSYRTALVSRLRSKV